MAKPAQQDQSKQPQQDVGLTSNDARLPEATPRSCARRESYLKTLQQIAGYVDRLRSVLEAAYEAPPRKEWWTECHQIKQQVAQQILSETRSTVIEYVIGGGSHWSSLESYSDDHPLVDLYMNICGITENLEARARATRAIPKDDISGWCARWSGLGRAGQKQIVRSPFGLEVCYEPSKMQSRQKDLRGAFYSDRGLIVVLENGEPAVTEMTLRHERIHAFLAGAFDFNEDLHVADEKRKFNALISQMNQRKGSLRGLADFKRLFHPTVVVDMTHEELLAELQNAMPALEKIGEDDYTQVFSTAGYFIDELTKHLIEQSAKVYNPTYQEEIARTSRDILSLFKRRITSLRQAFFVANQVSQDAKREVEALAIALLPSQWHHLNTYLDHRIGEQVTQPIHNVFRIQNRLVEVGERERQMLSDFGSERLDFHDKPPVS